MVGILEEQKYLNFKAVTHYHELQEGEINLRKPIVIRYVLI